MLEGEKKKKKRGREWLKTLGEEREKKNIEREREREREMYFLIKVWKEE